MSARSSPQMKQQGFYVFSGEVALLKEKSHRNPPSKKSKLPAPKPIVGLSSYPHVLNHSNHSRATTQGSKGVPIRFLTRWGRSRQCADPMVDFPRTILLHSLVSIQTSRLLLRISGWPSRKVCTHCHTHLSSRVTCTCLVESWEPKGKLPPGIRPILGDAALKATRLNEYNDSFYDLMPRIFPYDRFAMSVRVALFFHPGVLHAHECGMQKLIP